MKSVAVSLGLVACLAAGSGAGWAGVIDDGLAPVLSVTPADSTVSVLVYLRDRVDIDALEASLDSQRATLAQRHEAVVRALQAKAATTQGPLMQHLSALLAAGRIKGFDAYWIINAFRVDAPPAEVKLLANHPDVGTIYYNYEIESIEPTVDGPISRASGDRAVEPGVAAVQAPEAWALGYDGTGVLVATLDTGVDGNHPALASRWAGLLPEYAGHPGWAFYDPVTNWTFPQDSATHGTHTMGTVCGGAPGDEVGVAPGARWINAAVIDRVSLTQTCTDAIAAFQWLIDPDGNPATDWDVPAVCSNSWGIATYHNTPPYSNPCDSSFWSSIDACEAAGIVMLFSAGNEGPGASTLRRPADRATDGYRSLAVGGINANDSAWPMYSASSRGPTYCTLDGSAAIKPEVTAPGQSVRSSVPGGLYDTYSGTSMASPHVNGVVALIRQACPNLTVQQVKDILYATAHDMGTAGKDNDYGWGVVDAYAAVQMAVTMCGPHAPAAQAGSASTDVNTPVTITLHASDDGLPNPPGYLSYIIASLPAHGALKDPNGAFISAVPYTLLNDGAQVVFHPHGYFSGSDSFTFEATDGGTPPDGGVSSPASISLAIGAPTLAYSFPLDTNPGWTTQGQWAYGTPTGGGGQYGYPDPTSGHTGTKVYGYNLSGDYAANLPEYHLTSTPIDCSALSRVSLHFWRWLGVEQPLYDHAYVRVSRDNVNWTTVWQNAVQINDNSWVAQTLDISAVADHQPTVYLRWTMGTTDAYWQFCGWNVDDIEVWGTGLATPTLGDMNCDGVVNNQDIDPFVTALFYADQYTAGWPYCDVELGDFTGDGVVNNQDIDGFVAALFH